MLTAPERSAVGSRERDGEGSPWDRAAEQSVLGAMLAEPDAISEAVELLGDGGAFYRAAHRRLYNAIRKVHANGADVDPVTVAERLQADGELEAVGGMAAVGELIDAPADPAHAPTYARTVREKAILRACRDTLRQRLEAASTVGPGDLGPYLSETVETLRAIREHVPDSTGDGLRTVREILEDPAFRETPPVVADRLAWAGRVTLFAGREKSGKSTLIRWAVARRSRGKRVWGGPPVAGAVGVLYYGQEHPDDVAADLDRLGADPDRVHVRDMRGIAGDRFPALGRDLRAVEPSLVVVDTLSTLAAPLEPEPGSSADWEPIMDRIGALARDAEAAFVLNHHANKADGRYRDSTAIGAGVDAILEMRRSTDGPDTRREVEARSRSSIRVRDYAYELAGTESDPRLELVDESLPLSDRVRRFVERHGPCSQRQVREGVKGRANEIKETLDQLSEVEKEETPTGFRYSIPENPHGTGTEPDGNRPGTGGTGQGGGGGSEGPPLSRKGEGSRNRPAEPVDDNRCEGCGTRVGPTADRCASCKAGGAE